MYKSVREFLDQLSGIYDWKNYNTSVSGEVLTVEVSTKQPATVLSDLSSQVLFVCHELGLDGITKVELKKL